MYRKTVAFLRSLILHRPGRHVDLTRTRQKVFGTDLAEHMLTSCYEGKLRPLHLTPNISFLLRDVFSESYFAIAYTVHLLSVKSLLEM
jgi:hypothetical protein